MSFPSIPEPGRRAQAARRAVVLPALLLTLAVLGPLLAMGLGDAQSAAAEASRRRTQATAEDALQAQFVAAVFAAAPALAQTPALPTAAWLEQTLRLHGGLADRNLVVEAGPHRFDSAGSAATADPPFTGSRRQLVADLRLELPEGPHLRRELTLLSLPVSAWALAGDLRWSPGQVSVTATGGLLLQPAAGVALPAPTQLNGWFWACDPTGRPLAVPGQSVPPGWRWLPPANLMVDPTPGAAEADAVEIDLAASMASPAAWSATLRVIGSWRIGGQEGQFGGAGGPAPPLPFAGMRVTGSTAPRFHIDLTAWDGPSRLKLRGNTGWVVITGTEEAGAAPLRIELDSPGPVLSLVGPNYRPVIVCASSARLTGEPPWRGVLLLQGQLRLEPEDGSQLLVIDGALAGSATLVLGPEADPVILRATANPALGEQLRRHGLHLPGWILTTLE